MQLMELQSNALQLHPDERETLAHALLDSLTEEHNAEISEAWMAEIDQRIKDVDKGRVTMIPYEQFRDEIRKKPGANASHQPIGYSGSARGPSVLQ